MRRTKKFKEVFKDMKVGPVKEWRVTTSKTIHKNKKKEQAKYACRKKVRV